jgi:hypothetical protein
LYFEAANCSVESDFLNDMCESSIAIHAHNAPVVATLIILMKIFFVSKKFRMTHTNNMAAVNNTAFEGICCLLSLPSAE